MAREFAQHKIQPEVVLGSSAVRVQQTLEIMREAGFGCGDTRQQSGLYLASPAEIANYIGQLGGDCSTCLVVGHNPGMSTLASLLANKNVEMPTAAVAFFQSPCDAWLSALEQGNWIQTGMWKPRDLE